jgi:hypothetical protein
MAIALAPNDLVKVSAWVTNSEQAAVIRWWFKIQSVGSPAATDLGMAINIDAGLISNSFLVTMPSQCQYNGVQAQIYRGLPPTQEIFIAAGYTGSAGPGTGGTVAQPRQVAGITRWGTPFAGRQFRGRTYWPFPATTSDTGDGIPTPLYVSQITAISNFLLAYANVTGAGTATCDLVLVHRMPKSGIIPNPTVMSAATVENKWATQRRRGSFGRPNVSPI